MNIDNQDKNNMNLNSDSYNSILCDQGALFNKQRNELTKSFFNKASSISIDEIFSPPDIIISFDRSLS